MGFCSGVGFCVGVGLRGSSDISAAVGSCTAVGALAEGDTSVFGASIIYVGGSFHRTCYLFQCIGMSASNIYGG